MGSNMMKFPPKGITKKLCLCRKALNITKENEENEMLEMGRLRAKGQGTDENFSIAQISTTWGVLG